jgi:DNA-binding MarR family transcriptional regulator/GNAT superfamily N-acetyltransferase
MDPELHAQVEAVRGFNRDYTRRIGVLNEGLLASPYTLTQARVLFELGQRGSASAGELVDALGLDPGYLSRLLRGFVAARLVLRQRSALDGRRVDLALTPHGRTVFDALEQRSRAATAALIEPLAAAQRERLLDALRCVQSVLAPRAAQPGDAPHIREHRIGDVGWAIERHARVYHETYGWNQQFEGMVASLFADFLGRADPARQRFWVAEIAAARVGCVFVVPHAADPTAAQLRCLLVDPAARGHGLGRRLVDGCLEFATSAGYRRMVLWTNDILLEARRIYEAAGFELTEQSAHHSFGQDLVGQTWSRAL